ncbi:UDP-N-acetylglucosamine 2-epimerase [Alphaproteobacteria bacterium]|nr:UDP-N-acetylglucosamine 2-epimerase [Alphaproteobacteria bacterium]
MKIKRKICFVITARASYSRILTAIQEAKKNPNLSVLVVASGSFNSKNFGVSKKILKKDNININHSFTSLISPDSIESSPKTTAIQIMELSTYFKNSKPDIVVTVADRYETIATAIASSYMNITLVHIQGGEVTGNIDEKVRHAITKLADYHFVSNKDSKDRIIKMGEEHKSVYITGCPSIDIAKKVLKNVIKINLDGVGYNINLSKDYLVVMNHPDTYDYKASRFNTNKILDAVSKTGLQTIWFWPNPDLGTDSVSEAIRAYREINKNSKILFIKNLEPEVFLKLLSKSKCLIGNSSVGLRECSLTGLPVVNIGKRQQRRIRSNNVIDVEEDTNKIFQAIIFQIKRKKYKKSYLFGKGNSGKIISRLLASIKLKTYKQITY